MFLSVAQEVPPAIDLNNPGQAFLLIVFCVIVLLFIANKNRIMSRALTEPAKSPKSIANTELLSTLLREEKPAITDPTAVMDVIESFDNDSPRSRRVVETVYTHGTYTSEEDLGSEEINPIDDPFADDNLEAMTIVPHAAIAAHDDDEDTIDDAVEEENDDTDNAPLDDTAVAFDYGSPDMVPNAGWAQARPISDMDAIVAYMQRDYAQTRRGKTSNYLLPIVWYVEDGSPCLLYAPLVNGTNHVLYTGMNESGKDNAITQGAIALMKQLPPEDLQFFIVDAKGLDWAWMEGSAYTAMLSLGEDKEMVKRAMQVIADERQRRQEAILEKKLRSWRPGIGIPMAVIIVTEMSLLQTAVGKKECEEWLNACLTSYRGYGGRMLIGTQTVSNLSTTWRGQIGIFAAAAQPAPSQDEPNCNMQTSDIVRLGMRRILPSGEHVALDTPKALPPSQLPSIEDPNNRGVMTVIKQGARDAITGRTSFIDDAMLAEFAATLPRREDMENPLSYYEVKSRSIAQLASQMLNQPVRYRTGLRRPFILVEEAAEEAPKETTTASEEVSMPDEEPSTDAISPQTVERIRKSAAKMNDAELAQAMKKLRSQSKLKTDDEFITAAARLLFNSEATEVVSRIRAALNAAEGDV